MKLHIAVLSVLLALSCRKNGKNPDLIDPSQTNPETPGMMSSGSGDGTSPDAPLCAAATATCSQTLPKFDEPGGYSDLYKKAISGLGNPTHRARDVMIVEGKPVWILAKFAYGANDADLKDEPVDIWLAQGCGADWKKITSAKTSKDNQNKAIEGVDDTGGRIFLELSSVGVTLPVGRHHLVLNVPADNTYAEMYVTVLPANSKLIVTDIDGTLTTSEFAAASEIINIQPKSHEKVQDMLQAFYERGYHIFYLTARPDWLMGKTRAWLRDLGFPPGSVHTSNSLIGANLDAAAKFKIEELKFVKENTGLVPAYAFGNKPSDVKAFGTSGIDPKTSYYFKLEGDPMGGVVHENYGELIQLAEKAPAACR